MCVQSSGTSWARVEKHCSVPLCVQARVGVLELCGRNCLEEALVGPVISHVVRATTFHSEVALF